MALSTGPRAADPGVAFSSRHRIGWLMLGIILIALNLRGAVVGAGPLIKDIQAATQLPAAALGLLVALPLLGFGLLSPVAPALARRFGLERVLLVSMGLLALGIAWRSVPDEIVPWLPAHASLFGGTVLIGCCIALGNVLVPSLIRRDIPTRTGLVTSIFVSTFAGSGALAAVLAVPLEGWLGWRGSLAAWVVPALVALVAWIPLSRRGRESDDDVSAAGGNAAAINVWRSPLAWAVTTFMGLQSLLFYVLIAWLPTFLRESGQSPAEAGLGAFIFQMSGLAGGMLAPALVARARDQRFYAVFVSVPIVIGYVLLYVDPSVRLGSGLAGFGCGASLGVAVVLFSARSANAQDTAALSGMAQSIGYLVSAAGPVVFGLLHDWTQSWTVPLAVIGSLSVVQVAIAFVVGRPGVMRPGRAPASS